MSHMLYFWWEKNLEGSIPNPCQLLLLGDEIMGDSLPLWFFELRKFFLIFFFLLKAYIVFIKKIHNKATSFWGKNIHKRGRAHPTLTYIFLTPFTLAHSTSEHLSSLENASLLGTWRAFFGFWGLSHKGIEVPLCAPQFIKHCESQTSKNWLSILGSTNIKHLGFSLYQHLAYWHNQLFSCEGQTVGRIEKHVIQCFLCPVNSEYKQSSEKGETSGW